MDYPEHFVDKSPTHELEKILWVHQVFYELLILHLHLSNLGVKEQVDGSSLK